MHHVPSVPQYAYPLYFTENMLVLFPLASLAGVEIVEVLLLYVELGYTVDKCMLCSSQKYPEWKRWQEAEQAIVFSPRSCIVLAVISRCSSCRSAGARVYAQVVQLAFSGICENLYGRQRFLR